MSTDGLEHSLDKMRNEGVHDAAVNTFAHYYEMLARGERGVLAEADIEPVESLPDAGELPEADAPLDQCVVIKLNGGLGTSMGMQGPKSLLEVKDGMTFLDLAARQVVALRESSGARLPLVLMNSFATREPSMERLASYEGVRDFVQNKIPKIDADTLEPATWERDPGLEWCPPGHGDLFTALLTSGTLDDLLADGLRYAFVSNVDNVGAVVDPRILAWFAGQGIPFAMEALRRTAADRKGGHLARHDGRLVLREVAQTPDEDIDAFQDTARHRFFNSNNLWVDLEALRAVLAEREGVLGLPLIVNRKTVDPADKSSTPVFQLETAMGAAIEVFEGAQAIVVPRERFAPTKTTNDLLVLRSDAWRLADGARLELAAADVPLVSLDDDHYKLVGDFEQRFPEGPPSLVRCHSLTVKGDVTFGRDVVVVGDVVVEGVDRVEDGQTLS
jgi:UTP--glucose-1-phosphate uridylyltransferase